MKVDRQGDRNHVRVEELLPCPRFHCIHELMSCAIYVWCPDGCYDSNNYGTVCIPKCIDCIFYNTGECEEWRKFPDTHEHSAVSKHV